MLNERDWLKIYMFNLLALTTLTKLKSPWWLFLFALFFFVRTKVRFICQKKMIWRHLLYRQIRSEKIFYERDERTTLTPLLILFWARTKEWKFVKFTFKIVTMRLKLEFHLQQRLRLNAVLPPFRWRLIMTTKWPVNFM